MSWQKNFRKIPQKVINKLNTIDSDEIIVGFVKKIKKDDIQNNIFAHLQIHLDEKGLHHPDLVIPSAQQGKYSGWNTNGKVVIRKDLPKETHYNYVESPNWGDSSKGTHEVTLPYEKYPREYIAPQNSAIEIESADKTPDLSHYVIKFQVSEILDRSNDNFKKRLFFCLNLLQENIGASGIEKADVTFEEYIQTLQVSWDILPPGTIDEVFNRVFQDIEPSEEDKNTTIERYHFFMSLNPQKLVYGRSSFQKYFGALLEEDLVVFENIKYGNAIYVMFDNWQELSQKSRIELLSGKFGENFERVIHVGDWQTKVREIIESQQE